jgi:hypothetical protein
VDKEIKLRARAEGLAVKKFFNCGQVGRGFSLDIPFHRTIDYTNFSSYNHPFQHAMRTSSSLSILSRSILKNVILSQ